MDVEIVKIGEEQEEKLTIHCHEITDEVREIVTIVKSRQGHLSGSFADAQYEIPVSDVYYLDSVDGKTFLYTKENVYETGYRLYELEELLRNKQFLRISKSTIVNLMKIDSIRPALNGRFSAFLRSGEELIISRKYVKDFKEALKGGQTS